MIFVTVGSQMPFDRLVEQVDLELALRECERGPLRIGGLAEDVPDIVAMTDRKSLSTMDIVAVLTRVVQEQEQRILKLEQQLEDR